MGNFKFFNIGKANAEIESAEAAIAPAIAKSNITTITVDGKPMAAGDAPLAAKISALLAANPPGAGAQNVSDVLVSNDILAKQLEKVSGENALAQTSVGNLLREKAALETTVEEALASVGTLTAEKADLNNRLTAAMNQFSASAREMTGFNDQLSKLCLDAGCLELGLAVDASAEQKQAAAAAIPVGDKLKSYQGAVNAALARLGIDAAKVPNGGPGASGQSVTQIAIAKQYAAITDPTERVRFYRANKDAIDAGYRN
jgi:hypothetical protein